LRASAIDLGFLSVFVRVFSGSSVNKGMVFSDFRQTLNMEDKSNKKVNLFGDPDKLPEESRTSDSYLDHNPGLKDEKVIKQRGGLKDLLNENDPLEEKKAIERTSEDRLDEAE
jgi:hypothetical protein